MTFFKIYLNMMRQFYLRTTPSCMEECPAIAIYQIFNRAFGRLLSICT